MEHFEDIIDYSFTAQVEQEFDKIATGQNDWEKMIENFYHPFHEKVEKTADAERPQGRELGVDPKTNKKVFARLGRFGPIVQIGESSDEEGAEKPKYASLRSGQLLENISLEDALELFKLPRTVGTYEENEITVAIGRFGPYIRHDNKFTSLSKEDDPYTIEHNRAIELIEAKRKADAEKFIKSFDENPDIQVLNGRYGPYIKAGKKNVKIPKDKDPKSLTLEECLDLAEKTPDKKRRGRK
jgi:DNA topoisomerase-1